MKLIRRAIWAAAIIFASVFAFINFHTVKVNFDPLGISAPEAQYIEAPLAYVIIGSVGLGLIIGVFLAYGASTPTRRELSAKRRETDALRVENERITEALKAADHPDSAGPRLARY